MAAPPPQPPARGGGGLSLYANLLEENSSSASISRDPVLFTRDDGTAKKPIDPALRFQPIRRPQLKPATTTRPKPAFPKAPPPSSTATTPAAAAAAAAAATTTTSTPAPAAPGRSTLADWAAAEEDEYLHAGAGVGGGEKRQRGGRRNKRKKKNNNEELDLRETDWGELYDPARPTNVEEYLRSGERVREVREWRAVLYAHRWGKGQGQGRGGEVGEGDGGSGSGSEKEGEKVREGRDDRFAPPPSLTFAPPPMSPSRSAAPVPNDATGDDAYARRLVLSGMAPPPPPPATTTTDTATISRAPVRYSPPPPPPPPPDEMDIDAQDDYDPEVDYTSIPLPPPSTTTTTTTTTAEPDEQQQQQQQQNRTARPGQKDFARRLMTKYGWTKGTGLGASASGITSALRVEVEKRRRKPDAQGGGFADPKGGRGRIIAPKSTTAAPHSKAEGGGGDKEAGRFGNMSVVVLLEHMLENMADLEAEVEAGLGQEIGEECGERYGRVERIVVDVEGRRVFIRFVEAVSALRAVNALEGRIFNGSSIVARFYDEERFEEGIYYDE